MDSSQNLDNVSGSHVPRDPVASNGLFTYDDALTFLGEALAFGIEPSLDGVRALLDELGNPQTKFASIQVAGTNGKTSTARMIAALVRSQGMRVGLYTSPELIRYPERIEVNATVITDDAFAHAIATVAHAIPVAEKRSGRPITEFEITTAAALWEFAREHVDIAVLEVGLGGTWDSTSVVDPAVAVITGVGLDHTAILGETLEEIAGEKAGIIKPASTPILGPGTAISPSVEAVILGQAERCVTFSRAVREAGEGTPVPEELTIRYVMHAEQTGTWMVDVEGIHGTYPNLQTPGPRYQSLNIATAIAATEAALGRALDPKAARGALAGLVIPGRFEQVWADPLIVVDGSHNPQAARVLATEIDQHVASRFFSTKPVVLLGMLSDKDARGFIEEIAPAAQRIVVTRPSGDRALSEVELARIVTEVTGVVPEVYASIEEALGALLKRNANIVATGSIKTAGQIKAYIHSLRGN